MKLRDIDWELADFLLDIVINKRGNPTYKEVAEELTKRLGREINPHYSLGHPLGVVSTVCFELGLPLISARVIYSGNTSSQAVGEGFYPFACQFRPEYKKMTPVDAWKNELKLIRECPNWHRLRDYLDGVPIDEIFNKEKITPPEDHIEHKPSITTQEPSVHGTSILIADPVFPDEVDTSVAVMSEGTVKSINVNVRERNPTARKKCIEYYGTSCAVCGVDLGDIYGKEFSGRIHVHHLNPLSSFNGQHDINAIDDLRPVCPNCHMIIHCRPDKPYSIEEVQELMNRARKKD